MEIFVLLVELTTPYISNICHRGFVGLNSCLQIFSELLKPKSEFPKAKLLMLFINAAIEEDHLVSSRGDSVGDIAGLEIVMKQLEQYVHMVYEDWVGGTEDHVLS